MVNSLLVSGRVHPPEILVLQIYLRKAGPNSMPNSANKSPNKSKKMTTHSVGKKHFLGSATQSIRHSHGATMPDQKKKTTADSHSGGFRFFHGERGGRPVKSPATSSQQNFIPSPRWNVRVVHDNSYTLWLPVTNNKGRLIGDQADDSGGKHQGPTQFLSDKRMGNSSSL